jgi:subtilisin family serine protease
MAKHNYHIHSGKRSLNQTFETIPSPSIYRASDYGFHETLSGRGVKIAILDSGRPEHPDIANISQAVDMSETDRDEVDHHGHSTMVSGILTSNNPVAIMGICPDVELLYAKVANYDNECSYNALVAGVLWAIVKQVDIILICLGSETDYSVLHDAVKKAYNCGICVLAASGNKEGKEEYPAVYPEVLSVGRDTSQKEGKFKNIDQYGVKIIMPYKDIYTTYLHGRYAKASGSSLAAAMGAGLAALIIERLKERDGKRPTVNSVYSELSSLSYKPHSYKRM